MSRSYINTRIDSVKYIYWTLPENSIRVSKYTPIDFGYEKKV